MSKVDVIMPQMGESIAEGTLTKWLKQIGDTVDRDEDLFEISTDKVDADIPSPVAGTLVEILVEEGATVEVNTVVARIDTKGGAAATAEAQPEVTAEPAAEPPAAAEPLLPEISQQLARMFIRENQILLLGNSAFVAAHDHVFSPRQGFADRIIGLRSHDQDACFYRQFLEHALVFPARPVRKVVRAAGDHSIYRQRHQ